jgi:hypothetical protein
MGGMGDDGLYDLDDQSSRPPVPRPLLSKCLIQVRLRDHHKHKHHPPQSSRPQTRPSQSQGSGDAVLRPHVQVVPAVADFGPASSV